MLVSGVLAGAVELELIRSMIMIALLQLFHCSRHDSSHLVPAAAAAMTLNDRRKSGDVSHCANSATWCNRVQE
jgi:hypothetical protein